MVSSVASRVLKLAMNTSTAGTERGSIRAATPRGSTARALSRRARWTHPRHRRTRALRLLKDGRILQLGSAAGMRYTYHAARYHSMLVRRAYASALMDLPRVKVSR